LYDCLLQRETHVAVKKGLANMGALGFADAICQDVGWENGGK
jgi:hypothetical protein